MVEHVARGPFPAGFRWGVATSAPQIEGASGQRGASIWDVFAATPGKVRGGDDLQVACDHLARYREDVALMADMGVDSYRFSISWPRVDPGGTGAFPTSGMDFYDRLVDELLAAGIDPVATLYHWDLPAELGAVGGWTARAVTDRFADYAAVVGARLADRVSMWATHNEPWCASLLSYAAGIHAPGQQDPAAAVAAAHHTLLSHGLAVRALRAAGAHDVGIVLNSWPVHAVDGAQSELADQVRRIDGLVTRLFLDPLLTAAYPADVRADLSPWLDDVVNDGDLAVIAEPLDWLGLNYYHDDWFEPAVPGVDDAATLGGWPFPRVQGVRAAPVGAGATDSGWPVTPDGLRAHLVRLHRDHPDLPPVYVTENGAAYDDPVLPDGTIDDVRRVAYLASHIGAVADAMAQGVDVRGYFAWSLLDNFEWAEGYAVRFGLVHVDFDTLVRTPRRSAGWYRDFVAAGAPLDRLDVSP